MRDFRHDLRVPNNMLSNVEPLCNHLQFWQIRIFQCRNILSKVLQKFIDNSIIPCFPSLGVTKHFWCLNIMFPKGCTGKDSLWWQQMHQTEGHFPLLVSPSCLLHDGGCNTLWKHQIISTDPVLVILPLHSGEKKAHMIFREKNPYNSFTLQNIWCISLTTCRYTL